MKKKNNKILKSHLPPIITDNRIHRAQNIHKIQPSLYSTKKNSIDGSDQYETDGGHTQTQRNDSALYFEIPVVDHSDLEAVQNDYITPKNNNFNLKLGKIG